MGFLTSLFGGDGLNLWSVGLSLIIVLLLIVAAVWLLKVLFNATGRIGRNSNKRLAIIDSIPVDSKRNLVLVRRDQVEHLLLVGGGQDVAVETGIPAEYAPSALPDQKMQRANANPERKTAAAASRLGLTSLLRRYNLPGGTNSPQQANEAQPRPDPQSKPVNRPRFTIRPATPAAENPAAQPAAQPLSPLDRLKALGMHRDEQAPQPLRRMGLLTPKTPPESVNGAAEAQKSPDQTADSDNMPPDPHDHDAMASVEHQPIEQHGPGDQDDSADQQHENRSQNA
ncbi:MAG: flagellar biosynthetic protein FliO [Hyphomicrobiaceae bacterium]|nr:flagellar biosynthetic protein FliO [Hyphomicrobiaceae bacterium]